MNTLTIPPSLGPIEHMAMSAAFAASHLRYAADSFELCGRLIKDNRIGSAKEAYNRGLEGYDRAGFDLGLDAEV